MGKNVLIYGGISKSNIIFEWVAEATACDACQALDGAQYNSIDEIPDRPHPNCKCYVKDIHIDKEDYKALQC